MAKCPNIQRKESTHQPFRWRILSPLYLSLSRRRPGVSKHSIAWLRTHLPLPTMDVNQASALSRRKVTFPPCWILNYVEYLIWQPRFWLLSFVQFVRSCLEEGERFSWNTTLKQSSCVFDSTTKGKDIIHFYRVQIFGLTESKLE